MAVVGGTVLAVAGMLPLLGGVAGLAKGDEPPVPTIATVAVVGGLHFIGGGIALIVWGQQERWVRGEATTAPVVRVGATSASAQWAF